MVDLKLAQKIINYLNELVALDKPCIAAMVSNRIPCNEKLAEHPSCQVGYRNGGFSVGLLGIINGMCGTYDDGPRKGWGAIAANFNTGESTDLIGFELLENVEGEKKNS